MTIHEMGKGPDRASIDADELVKLTPSELCSRTGIQNCHCCERHECGDNQSPAVLRLRSVEGDFAKLAARVVAILESPEPVRLAVAAALRLGDPADDILEILGEPRAKRRLKR